MEEDKFPYAVLPNTHSRMDRGLTQRILASRMNVPRTYISKVEMGRVMPTLETLGRFAAALRIDLISDESERLGDAAIGRIMDDLFLVEIAQVAGRLSAVHRVLICALCAMLPVIIARPK